MKTKRNLKRGTCKINYIPAVDKDIKAVIEVDAIRHNLHFLKSKTKTEIMPVLKADAYGHGLVEVARVLRKMQVAHLGVATLGEAILLRKSGDRGRILSWMYNVDGQEFKDGLKLNLDIAIFDETSIPKIKKMVPKGVRIKVTMFVDTGINRAGIPYDKAFQAVEEVAACDKFDLVGLMSHLVCSEVRNSPIVHAQLAKFRALRDRLKGVGINPPLVHIANTMACLNYDVSDFTLARSGCGIYGIAENPHLKIAMTVKSVVIQLKDLGKGEGIGYNWKYKTPKKMKIAVVPVGYADILPWSADKLHVYINGTKRKVLGAISMDQISVEARDHDSANDEVIIFGNGSNCPQTIFDVAGKMLPIEILCHLGYRINRTYLA